MRVAIAQVDGKWPNLALAKLAAYHKAEWWNPLAGADVVYASKVFTDSPDDPYLPEDAIRGGSGYDLATTLPDEVERTKPDWSLWPWWDKDVGFTTRGCVRRCPFCIVPAKEGGLRVVAEFGDVTTGRRELVLLDNNLTAAPIGHFRAVCEEATRAGVAIDINQGLDARLLTDEHAAILRRTKLWGRVHMAFDHVADEPHVRRAVETMQAARFRPDRMTFFVLVGFDSTPDEDLYRVEVLRSLGANPFVMKYRHDDPYQTRFARWVNTVVGFKSMTWPEWCATFKVKLPAKATT